MDFQTELTEQRKQAGISVYKLSELSGVPKSTIFNYERGVAPTIDKADKLLRALGVTLVLGDNPETKEKSQHIYEGALNKWGKESQTRMMFEEMAELQKELCKEARGEDNTDAIAEEIADVKIMLEQMIILHNCKDMVEMQMKRKLQRLKERLEGE
ncbi:MAG: helix-turn-helix domain-containing protein [Candidatus Pararuminococcus gallinarum]